MASDMIDLTALIAECDASPPDTEGSDTRMLIDPRVLAEIARDARRFRWLEYEGKQEPAFVDGKAYIGTLVIAPRGKPCTLREAIDADMGEAP